MAYTEKFQNMADRAHKIVEGVAPDAVDALIIKGAIALDIRDKEEHDAGHIAGSLKWSHLFGQFCGLSKMHLVFVHAAFRISAWPKYAMSGVRLSSAV
jgi:rhodanese-related sulfurtransferase